MKEDWYAGEILDTRKLAGRAVKRDFGATILPEEEITEIGINQKNVGRIAERIVANELE